MATVLCNFFLLTVELAKEGLQKQLDVHGWFVVLCCCHRGTNFLLVNNKHVGSLDLVTLLATILNMQR